MANIWRRHLAAFKSRQSYSHGRTFHTLVAAEYLLPIRIHRNRLDAPWFPRFVVLQLGPTIVPSFVKVLCPLGWY